MVVSVGSVVDAFELLYENLLDRKFAKSACFSYWRESDLLPLVRAYLLGYFGRVDPEVASSLPGCATKAGRLDFCIGNIGVELAVRTKKSSKYGLCAALNFTERKKLLRWPGRGVLILFDFANPPLSDKDLEAYRELPTMGKGNWAVSAFKIAYFHQSSRPKGVRRIEKTIRVW